MSAPIVYDGVGGSDSGGSLFRGLKFWVAQRVPQRNDMVNKIKANGGDVVPLEKQADMLIADHARKDAPANSHSWKYITESVKNGRLEDKEPHRIGPLVAVARRAGSSAPSKGTRNPFTTQDDEILTKWVLLSERKGAMAKGNTIYQDLERMHPNHTWQSWRDRWVRKLSLIPRANLPDVSEDEFRLPDLRTAPAATPPSASSVAVRRQQDVPRPSQTVGRVKFTEEDDDLLRKFVREAREHGKYVKGNKIYEELAEQYPHHSYQSWRDRYVRILSRNEDGDVETRVPEQAPRTANASPAIARNSASIEAPASATPAIATPAPGRPPPSTASPSSAIAQEVKARLQKQQMNRERRIAAQNIQRCWRGYKVRKELAAVDPRLVELQAAARGFTTRLAVWGTDDEGDIKQEPPSPPTLPSAPAPSDDTGANSSSKDQFYRDLQTYISVMNQTMTYFPNIGGRNGRAVELWELWSVVTRQDLEPEKRDWEQIAERLGFNWIEYPDVVQQIKTVYENTLGDFEKVMTAFDMADESGDDEDEEDDSAGSIHSQITDIEVPGVDDAEDVREALLPYKSETNIPSSPPLPRGIKRAAAAQLLAGSDGSSEPVRKRARISRDSEIPSTPDPKACLARQGRLASSVLGAASPPASAVRLLTTPRARLAEPETQDFGYGPEADDEGGRPRETQYDITPSQQLRSESDAVSPVPMSLPRRHPASTSWKGADSEIFSSVPKAPAAASSSKQRPYRPGPEHGASGQSRRQVTEPEATPAPAGAEATRATRVRRSLPSSFVRPRTSEAQGSTPRTASAASVARGTAGPASSKARASAQARASPAARASAAPTSSSGAVTRRDSPAEILNNYMALGYERSDIITALKATNMRPGWPTSLVLEDLSRKKGVPANVQGVWTERDDRGLKFVDEHARSAASRARARRGQETAEERARRAKAEKERARLESKHGAESMEARRSWFRIYQAAE